MQNWMGCREGLASSIVEVEGVETLEVRGLLRGGWAVDQHIWTSWLLNLFLIPDMSHHLQSTKYLFAPNINTKATLDAIPHKLP